MPLDDAEVTPDVTRLRDSIDEELRAQFAMREIDVDAALTREMAYWVALQLDYAYEFKWSPRWEGGRS